MLTLNDGRSELWQWDTGRTLAVDADCSQVHFSNKVFGRSIDVDVVGGVAIIPDILLQTDKDLNVWAFVGTADNGYTKISKTFTVNRRNKPSDYVFTPTDQMTLQTIQRQIGDLADLTTEAKDTLVAAINEAARAGGGAGSMDLRVAGGYVQYSRDGGMTWTNLIAMEDLKGDPGAPGVDGKSAYQYAVEAGYTGTEAEFSARMAAEIPSVDSTLTKSGQAADASVVGNRLSALSEEIDTTSESKVSAHNTGTDTHSDIRLLIHGLTDRLNALADSDDTTLDQLSEVVSYIKSNRGLIEAITTSKVSVADIIDNLTTNVANKPLSAAQGVALKALIDAISVPDKLPNPNALTFTGAVSATYDGSTAVSVEIPSGGSGGTDISLGLTSATVGQTIKVKAVDESGKPTEWEAADMASEGINWQLVDSKTLTADDAVTELEWTGLACDNIYFTSLNQYGSNVTCTGIYVNGQQICKDFYQFEHETSIERNTLLITKMPENHCVEVIGNNYCNIISIIFNKRGYITNMEKIDSIKFVFSSTLSAQMTLSLYKG